VFPVTYKMSYFLESSGSGAICVTWRAVGQERNKTEETLRGLKLLFIFVFKKYIFYFYIFLIYFNMSIFKIVF
jgi:hypothetical protein